MRRDYSKAALEGNGLNNIAQDIIKLRVSQSVADGCGWYRTLSDGFLTAGCHNKSMTDISAGGRAARILLRRSFRRGTKTYDLLAAAPLIWIYGLGAAGSFRFLHQQAQHLNLQQLNPSTCLAILAKLAGLVLTSLVVCALFLRKPPISGAKGIAPRLAALAGTYTAVGIMALPAHEISALAATLSIVLILGGTAFAVYSISYLGRSFSLMAEARQLVTSGPYARIRHPLYLGEEIAIIGMTIQFFSPLAAVLLACQMACQLYRMRCEEQVLAAAFQDYEVYSAGRARILPGIY
jgi:protein-S-isoprenylcysteine O-methyltransferase Ste14